MIIRIDKCPKCGNDVVVVMPDLFPNLTAKQLEKFKRLSLMPIEDNCRHCKEQGGNK